MGLSPLGPKGVPSCGFVSYCEKMEGIFYSASHCQRGEISRGEINRGGIGRGEVIRVSPPKKKVGKFKLPKVSQSPRPHSN